MVTQGKLTNGGYLISRTVGTPIRRGNFSLEDTAAIMTMSTGIGTHVTLSFPEPTYLDVLQVSARTTEAARLALMDVIADQRNIDQMVVQFENMTKGLSGTVGGIRIIPVSQPQIYEYRRGVVEFPDINDLEAAQSLPAPMDRECATQALQPLQPTELCALAFMDNIYVETPQVLDQRIRIAMHVLARFFPDKAFVWDDTFQVRGSAQLLQVPAAYRRYAENPCLIIDAMADKLRALMTGESLRDRISTPEAQTLMWHSLWHELNDMPSVQPIVVDLPTLKSLLEIVVGLKGLTSQHYTFLRGGQFRESDFEILMANFDAVERVEQWFRPYFNWIPLARRYVVKSAKSKWIITAAPWIARTTYGMISNRLDLGVQHVGLFGALTTQGNDPVPLISPEELDPNLAQYTTLRTYYRTNTPVSDLVCTVDTVMSRPTPNMATAYHELETLIMDRMLPDEYLGQRGTGPVGEATNIMNTIVQNLDTGYFAGNAQFSVVIPLSGAIMREGGAIMMEALIPGYSMSVITTDGVACSTDCVWNGYDDDLLSRIGTQAQEVPIEAPTPWIAR